MLETQAISLAFLQSEGESELEEYHADNKMLVDFLIKRANLTKIELRILEHIYFDGYSQREISMITGCSQSNISKTHKAAIRKLKSITHDAMLTWEYLPKPSFETDRSLNSKMIEEYVNGESITIFRNGKHWLVTEEGELKEYEPVAKKEGKYQKLSEEEWNSLIGLYGMKAADIALFADRADGHRHKGTHHGYLSNSQMAERMNYREIYLFEEKED